MTLPISQVGSGQAESDRVELGGVGSKAVHKYTRATGLILAVHHPQVGSF